MKRLPVKLILSWLVAVSGLLTGFCGLVISGQTWVGDDDTAKTLQAVGWMLLGLVFLAASFFALYNRRRAACLFLVCVPVAAFCLGYPDAATWGPCPDLDGICKFLPGLPAALSLEALFYVAIFVPMLAIRSRKRAVILFLVLAALVVSVFAALGWLPLLRELAAWSAAMVAFGGFWRATDRLGWPPLLVARPQPLGKRFAMVALGCVLVAVLDLAAAFVVSAARASALSHPMGEISARPWRPGHVAFTAQVICVQHDTRISGRWEGKWAIARVKEHFWGLSEWHPPFVLLTNTIFSEGESYFIDSFHEGGFLTRFLPIVNVGRYGHSDRLANATLALYVVRKALPENVHLVIGQAFRSRRSTESSTENDWYTGLNEKGEYTRMRDWRWEYAPYAGAKIRISGPSGTAIVTANQDGIYEVGGLTPDKYTLELVDLPDTQISLNEDLRKEELARTGPVIRRIRAVWNGSVEGRTRDLSGKPASVTYGLQTLGQKTRLGSLSDRLRRDDKTGSFRISELEAGRYVIQVNPNGPSDASPYAPLYYPSATRPEDARILEIATDGQHLKGVNFVLKRLRRRNLQVRVVWPTGQPVAGADVFLVYEHTVWYKQPYGWPQYWTTDRDGFAEVHVFGDSRVRLWAATNLPGAVPDPNRYSAPIELEGAKLPRRLEMVTSFTEAERPRWP